MHTDHDGFSTKGDGHHKEDKSKRNEISTNSTVILYDLEGIGAEDGLGYTVSISTANNGRRHHHRGSYGFGFSRRRNSSRQQDHQLSTTRSVGTAARSTSRLQKQAGMISSQLSSSPRGGGLLGSVDSAGPAIEEPLEIVERRTVEVRESFIDLEAAARPSAAQAENSERTGFAGALWRSRDAITSTAAGARVSGGSGGSAAGEGREAGEAPPAAKRSSGGRRVSGASGMTAFYDDSADDDDDDGAVAAPRDGGRAHAHQKPYHRQPQQRYQHLRTPSYPPASRRSTLTRGVGAASPLGPGLGGGRASAVGSASHYGSQYGSSSHAGGSGGSRSSSAAGGELPSARGASAAEAAAEDTSWMLEIATMREILHWQRREGSMCAEDGSLRSGGEEREPPRT
jgi:hypothetical protein